MAQHNQFHEDHAEGGSFCTKPTNLPDAVAVLILQPIYHSPPDGLQSGVPVILDARLRLQVGFAMAWPEDFQSIY